MLRAGYLKETESKIIYTGQGLELIRSNPTLNDSIKGYLRTKYNSEEIFKSYSRIGSGNNSVVHNIGNVAIKISTGSTGYLAYKHNTNIKPENLLLQTQFLHLLGAQFKKKEVKNLHVPEQFLAIKTRHGNFLSLHENLVSLQSLFSWIYDHDISYEDELELNEQIKARIECSLGNMALRFGVNDLGLKNNERLGTKNILIPSDTTDPLIAPITIIDQPSRGLANIIGGASNNLVFNYSKTIHKNLDELLDI